MRLSLSCPMKYVHKIQKDRQGIALCLQSCMLQKVRITTHRTIQYMKAQQSRSQSEGPSLRPRVIDVSEESYAAVRALVESGDTAYLERKAKDTILVI